MKKILIIGVGYAGKAVAIGILENKTEYEIIGYLDNDNFKVGKRFLGIEVKDRTDNLEKFLGNNKVDICMDISEEKLIVLKME